MVLAWRANPGRHTSEYIDDDDWKKSITEAGKKQMATCLMDLGINLDGVNLLILQRHFQKNLD